MTPLGVVVLALGIVYMLVMRFMLKGDAPGQQAGKRRTFRDLIREYRLTGRARRLAIRPGSPMVGQRLDDLKLRERYGANVIGVERWRRFRRVIVNVNGVSEFRARDVLLIDMSAAEVDLRVLRRATAGTDGIARRIFFRSGVGCRDGGNFAYSGV